MVRILLNKLLDLNEMPTNKMILKHIINVLSNFYYSLLILVSNDLTFLSIEDMICHLQVKDEHFHKMKPNEEALVFYFNKFIQNHGLAYSKRHKLCHNEGYNVHSWEIHKGGYDKKNCVIDEVSIHLYAKHCHATTPTPLHIVITLSSINRFFLLGMNFTANPNQQKFNINAVSSNKNMLCICSTTQTMV
jgi:hypothetical protein